MAVATPQPGSYDVSARCANCGLRIFATVKPTGRALFPWYHADGSERCP